VLLELIGLPAERIEPLMGQARDHVATALNARWHAGLSPHAPYTVHPDLLQRAAQVSREFKVPLSMHLAESEEELELLRSGAGPFVELLENLDAWDPTAIAHGTSVLDYLQVLSKSHRVLAVHGNYLNRAEIEFLAARNDHMSVVFCPRTHAYFGHKDYPLAEMLSAGVNVALGTDSRASNPDLSVLEEMRYVYRHCEAVSPGDILGLGTVRGAKSLGLNDQTGVLTAGKRADLTVVQLPDADSDDPFELLFGNSGAVVHTYCRGQAYPVESRNQTEPAG
jgi:cytosine/adenosine deaminase-related metal-dependent hydrolase